MTTSVQTNADGRCPACQGVLCAASSVGEKAEPTGNDLSVCMFCSVFLVFNTDLTVRLLTPAEYEGLDTKTKIKLQTTRVAIAYMTPGGVWQTRVK